MPASYRVTVTDRRWERASTERRALVLDLRFEIMDPDPATVAVTFNGHLRYPPGAFSGMTQAQIINAIRNTGIGGVPGLQPVAEQLLADWDATANIRSVALPFTFGP